MQEPRLGLPNLGFGVGLRKVHFAHISREKPAVDWFEIISENFMDSFGRPRSVLEEVASKLPDRDAWGCRCRIGSAMPLDFEYLGKLKKLAATVKARWVCRITSAGQGSQAEIPTTCCHFPYTEESLRHVVSRIRTVQDFLERPLVLENPSSYVGFTASTMTEWEFIHRMAEDAGSGCSSTSTMYTCRVSTTTSTRLSSSGACRASVSSSITWPGTPTSAPT